MEKRTNSPYPKLDRPILALVGVALVAGTVLFAWSDRQHDWRYYQYEFRAMVSEKFGAEKAATVPAGVQQHWIAGLGRADRCVTCHQAVSWKGFETAENPWKTHPVEPLRTHPVEKFGCTSWAGRSTPTRRTGRSRTGRSRCSAGRSARSTRSPPIPGA